MFSPESGRRTACNPIQSNLRLHLQRAAPARCTPRARTGQTVFQVQLADQARQCRRARASGSTATWIVSRGRAGDANRGRVRCGCHCQGPDRAGVHRACMQGKQQAVMIQLRCAACLRACSAMPWSQLLMLGPRAYGGLWLVCCSPHCSEV